MTHTCEPHTTIGEPVVCWACECGQNWEVHRATGQLSAISRLKAASFVDVAERQALDARIQLRKNPPAPKLHIVHDLTTPAVNSTRYDDEGLPYALNRADRLSLWSFGNKRYLVARHGCRVDTWYGKVGNFPDLRLDTKAPLRGRGLLGQTFRLNSLSEADTKFEEIRHRRVDHGYHTIKIF